MRFSHEVSRILLLMALGECILRTSVSSSSEKIVVDGRGECIFRAIVSTNPEKIVSDGRGEV